MVSTIISCRGTEADSHGLAVQQTKVLLLLQYIDKVIAVFCAGPAGRALLRETFEIPHCSSSYSCLDPVVDILVVAQVQIPLVLLPSRFSSCSTPIRWSTFFCAGPAVLEVEETAELPQLRRFAWTLALHMSVVVQRQLLYGR